MDQLDAGSQKVVMGHLLRPALPMYKARAAIAVTISKVGIVLDDYGENCCWLASGHISSRDPVVVVTGGRRYL